MNFRLLDYALDKTTERQLMELDSAAQKVRDGVPAQAEEAVRTVLDLSKQNLTAAIYLVGLWEVNGEHIPKDPEQGWKKIQTAADKNFGPAIYEIALRSIQLPNPSPKSWERMKWAARMGSVQAQFLLGDRCERGDGVTAEVWGTRECPSALLVDSP